ncbi:MAG: serine/threonine protein kinase [Symploca sp. SIO1B1]|nr:serine/threonine protein kinase [Symploca sp. SIO2D2]NER94806.1 serine/threonine protein kinase [Symploca sp. SIO1B1]
MYNPSPLPNGSVIENRYRIVCQLGQGGFGRTYQARDINQGNEYCVLKEFAPQLQSTNHLLKAQELFQREADILFKLKHPQIPCFRELRKVIFNGNEYLLLVQDYVEGKTYDKFVKGKQRFSEAEVIQLFLQVLPVLEYIHSQGMIHRDISPDNLICRKSDKLPILIDFGAVKQVAVTAISQFSSLPIGTQIGKNGYAPEEQMNRGEFSASSDLYALALTGLVLLTGKKPKELYDSYNTTWHWRREISLSPIFGTVLDKMLAYQPRKRYQSAREVRQVLEGSNSSKFASLLSRMKTRVVAPGKLLNSIINQSKTRINSTNREFRDIVIGVGITFFVVGFVWIVYKMKPVEPDPLRQQSPQSLPSKSLSSVEQKQQENIIKRREALKIPETEFNQKVDELFWAEYPELEKNRLGDTPEDFAFRQRWYQIAEEELDKLEQDKLL